MTSIPEDITGFLSDASNKNTTLKTKSDINIIQKFFETQNEFRGLEEIPHAELDILLSRFFIAAKRSDGSDYEPKSLRCFLSSGNRLISFFFFFTFYNGFIYPLYSTFFAAIST